jgi:hypothetical protein
VACHRLRRPRAGYGCAVWSFGGGGGQCRLSAIRFEGTAPPRKGGRGACFHHPNEILTRKVSGCLPGAATTLLEKARRDSKLAQDFGGCENRRVPEAARTLASTVAKCWAFELRDRRGRRHVRPSALISGDRGTWRLVRGCVFRPKASRVGGVQRVFYAKRVRTDRERPADYLA